MSALFMMVRMDGEQEKAARKYTLAGLDDIYLLNGYDEFDGPDGKRLVRVRGVEVLHKAIGKFIAEELKPLRGEHVRFLRKEMGCTQADVATMMGVDPQTVARWENEKVRDITPPAERLLRLAYLEHVNERPSIRSFTRDLDLRDFSSPLPNLEKPAAFFQRTNELWKEVFPTAAFFPAAC